MNFDVVRVRSLPPDQSVASMRETQASNNNKKLGGESGDEGDDATLCIHNANDQDVQHNQSLGEKNSTQNVDVKSKIFMISSVSADEAGMPRCIITTNSSTQMGMTNSSSDFDSIHLTTPHSNNRLKENSHHQSPLSAASTHQRSSQEQKTDSTNGSSTGLLHRSPNMKTVKSEACVASPSLLHDEHLTQMFVAQTPKSDHCEASSDSESEDPATRMNSADLHSAEVPTKQEDSKKLFFTENELPKQPQLLNKFEVDPLTTLSSSLPPLLKSNTVPPPLLRLPCAFSSSTVTPPNTSSALSTTKSNASATAALPSFISDSKGCSPCAPFGVATPALANNNSNNGINNQHIISLLSSSSQNNKNNFQSLNNNSNNIIHNVQNFHSSNFNHTKDCSNKSFSKTSALQIDITPPEETLAAVTATASDSSFQNGEEKPESKSGSLILGECHSQQK
eukprot:GDKJ01019904.1.p1 GENE.GDKJ01019904.1~~GDKJ01019904.1.p1  ORF type:complete len:509 (-),score=152.53 GDKJ01019904.1:1342-2694(-)